MTKEPTLFLDLDGVLADFDKGVKEVTGNYPGEQKPKDMWRALAHTSDFYYNLDFMSDGMVLWNKTKHLNPVILTGLPMGNWAKSQKERWVSDNLGKNVPIITCRARDKAMYCQPGDVLVDDREKIRDKWEAAGGQFVHHIDTNTTIFELELLGFL